MMLKSFWMVLFYESEEIEMFDIEFLLEASSLSGFTWVKKPFIA